MLSDLCIFGNIEDSNMICNQNTEFLSNSNEFKHRPTDTTILRYESCLLVNISLFFQERIKAR